MLFWLVLAVLAITNGIVRQSTYGRAMSDLRAHQLSTETGIAIVTIAVWLFASFAVPIESAGQAWLIGVLWVAMTIAFEFLFGHFVAGHLWSELLADYRLLRGRIWSLFLLWLLILPRLVMWLCGTA